jgi:sugar phosphate isomerase/epimerase
VKFTCTSWSWPLLSLNEVASIMNRLGFRAMDVAAFAGSVHLEPDELKARPREMAAKLKEIGARHQMVFTDLFVTFGRDLVERCVNFPDATVRAENLETLRRVADFSVQAGIPGITLCPGVEHPSLGRATSFELAREELARLAAMGHQAGLRISFEPHRESITESIADALRMASSVPNLCFTLDYSHFIAQGYAQHEIDVLLEHAGHMHLRQARRGILQARDDDGEIDFERILTTLEGRGYSGWLAFEYEWNAWQNNNRVDVLSETLLLKRRLARFDAVS